MFCRPGAHNFKTRVQNYCLCFMTNRFNYHSVGIHCSPTNLAVCMNCLETPCGDYWFRPIYESVLCRPCMTKELKLLRTCAKRTLAVIKRLQVLEKFVRYRYCGFYHDHAGTSAAVQVMSKQDLKFKIVHEDYLASFGY